MSIQSVRIHKWTRKQYIRISYGSGSRVNLPKNKLCGSMWVPFWYKINYSYLICVHYVSAPHFHQRPLSAPDAFCSNHFLKNLKSKAL